MKSSSKVLGRRAVPRGSVLLYTLIMLVIAAIAVVGVVALVWNHLRGTARAEARLRAFYAAEAGVQQVVDWFNRGYYTWFKGEYASRYPGVVFHTWEDGRFPDTTFQGYFRPFLVVPDRGNFVDFNGTSSFLNGAAQDRVVISKREGYEQNANWLDYIPAPTDPQTGFSAGYVEELRILRPAARAGKICRVVSIGKDPATGVIATVETDLNAPWLPEIMAPAALISKTSAASNGLFQVNWGEIWTKTTLDINNPIWNKFPDEPTDPWFKGRSEGMIMGGKSYADGLANKGFSDTEVPPTSPNYYQVFKSLDPRNASLRGFQNTFYQHQTLQWPDYEYRLVKAYCLRHDYPVYQTNADGLLIVGTDSTGRPILKTFEDVFNLAGKEDPDTIDRDVMPPLVFVDTVDGTAPKTDGSNLATIRITGSGPFFYGYFFVAANIYMGGSGNSPSLDNPEKPDRTISKTAIKNCRVMGLLYSYGQGDFRGQGDVYGSVYAKRGFQGGGTWNIYYDWRLSDPLRNRTGSRVVSELWDTYYGYPGN